MKKNLAVQSLVRATVAVAGLAMLSLPAFATVVSRSTPVAGAAMTQRAGAETRVLPPTLRVALYRSLAKDAGAAYDVNAKGCATLPGAELTACFNGSGAHFTGAGTLALHLVGYGRGAVLSPVKPVRPETDGNQVSYRYGDLTAWWRVLPMGFEQGFTVARRPAGHGELTLALAANRHSRESGNPVGKGIPTERRDTDSHWIPASASMTEKENGDAITWGKLHYGGLVVTDANGKVLPATMKARNDRILIAVNDAHAAYPLTIDPIVWIEQAVVASDGTASSLFGFAAAVSGNTAFIAAPFPGANGGPGVVYVFTMQDGAWVQTQELTANDAAAGAFFGTWLSLNGSTAVVGAAHASAKSQILVGSAYIFTESDGTWTQAKKLEPSDAAEFGFFGAGTALGDDVAFIGAGNDKVNGVPVPGSVYVFTYSDGTWTQTQKIPSPNQDGDYFGWQGDMAASGSTLAVGAKFATVNGNVNQGNVTIYTNQDGTWTQTQQLTRNNAAAYDGFGQWVVIDGDLMLVSASGAKQGQGVVDVFSYTGGSWVQTEEIAARDGVAGDNFGSFVAASGPTALIGAIGAESGVGKAYVFTNLNGVWTQSEELEPSDGTPGDNFAWSGALSGSTALVAADLATVHGNGTQGKAYFYGGSNLNLALSAPQTIGEGQEYTSQTIATNSSSVGSPAVSATIAVPEAASFVSATASQGSCAEGSGMVVCNFGQIPGNAGMATANVTLKATGAPGTTIENTASIAKATPALTASAPTTIGEGGACPAGYTEFDGHLDAGETFTSSPIEVTEAGQKYADLTSPASFAFFTITDTRYGQHTYVYPHVKHGHRWGAAGSYQVGVQAGSEAGGDYTLCVNLNPEQ